MKKILITGGNGLLGQSLRSFLSKANFEVIASGLGNDRLLNHNHVYVPFDISKKNDCENVLSIFNPDIIINTAAITNVDYCEVNKDECLKVNADSVNHFLPFCKKNNKKFIQISTDFLFDGKSGPYNEIQPYMPINHYGFSKMIAEKNIFNSGLSNFLIIRTCLVYGFKEDSNNIYMWVKRKLDKGDSVNIVDDQFRTPTVVSDLSQAILQAIKQDVKGVFNISSGEYLSIFDFVCNIVKAFGYDKSLLQRCKSNKINQKAARPKKSGLQVEKAIKAFGFSPTKIDVFLKSIT